MARKLVIINDPGIDGAVALALALHDPNIELLGIAATAGNVRADQATQNVHIVVGQIDPPRWPRIGSALPVQYDIDGTRLHGPHGLGAVSFPCASLHHLHSADKLVSDLVRQYPKEVTVAVLGPMTALARAVDRDPELPSLIQRVICVGGCWHEVGNASVAAEFHFFCDPHAARQVARCGVPLLVLPLDVTRQVVFSPTDLLEWPCPDSRTCKFLKEILPFGIRATSNLYGVEGFHLKDVLGIAALSTPDALTTKPVAIDVETRGDLTRGMSIIDPRPVGGAPPNADLAVAVDGALVRRYMDRVLSRAG
jgi:inosine-uridine nucleoside N-ribohydrolase